MMVTFGKEYFLSSLGYIFIADVEEVNLFYSYTVCMQRRIYFLCSQHHEAFYMEERVDSRFHAVNRPQIDCNLIFFIENAKLTGLQNAFYACDRFTSGYASL